MQGTLCCPDICRPVLYVVNCKFCDDTIPDNGVLFDAPPSFLVRIQNLANNPCGGSENWNGTWRVTGMATYDLGSGTFGCVWHYTLSAAERAGLQGFDFFCITSATTDATISVDLGVVGGTPSTRRIIVTLFWRYGPFTDTTDRIRFQLDVPPTNCVEFNLLDIPLGAFGGSKTYDETAVTCDLTADFTPP